MYRRTLVRLLQGLSILLSVMIGISGNYLTSENKPPSALAALQRWPVPVTAATLVVLLGVSWWMSRLDQQIGGRARSWTSRHSPYPGLEPFDEGHSSVFFGRERENAALSRRINPTSASVAARTLVVSGSSGTGKSSLLRAGLLPQLEVRARWAVVTPMTPGTNPFLSLAKSLLSGTSHGTADGMAAELRQSGAAALSRLLATLPGQRVGLPRPVLVTVDQAEELLTLVTEAERDAFLGLLEATLAAERRLKILFAFRSEFLTRLPGTRHAHLFQDTFLLGPIERRSLFTVVAGPAERAGIALEAGLAELMVDEAVGGDALPLLAYTLHRLVPEAIEDRRVTIAEYQRIGGVASALTERADQILQQLTSADPGAPVLSTLVKFVTITNGQPSGRPVKRDLLDDQEQAVVEAFLADRLLVSDEAGNEPILRVAHEALFRQWEPLLQAITAILGDLTLAADLERWAEEWERSGRHESYLVRDERLRTAVGWARRQHNTAAEYPLVTAFIDASRRADEVAMRWLSEAVAQRSLAAMEDDPEYGLLLALAALEDCADTHMARLALVKGIASTRMCIPLTGHTDLVQRAVWSPDGALLATCCYDGSVRVWQAADGFAQRVIECRSGYVHGVAWMPDGQRVVSAGQDGAARIWSVADGSEIAVLRGHLDFVRGVAVTADGTMVATASQDGTIRLWETATGRELHVLAEHTGFVHGVAFSPDGTLLATSGLDREVRVWETATGTPLAVLAGHQELIRTVAWAADGNRLASASYDHSVRVWDVSSGQEVLCLTVANDLVQSVAWSPDGTKLVTAASDCVARVWDASTGLELLALHGHRSVIRDASFSPDGRRVATVANDGSGRIWDLMRPDDVVMLHGHSALVEAASWASDGRHLATASFDNTARIWDHVQGAVSHTLTGHQDPVRDVDWSPDAQLIATASNDRTLRIWSASTGRELHLIRAHADRVEGVAWSPDGALVATTSNDRTVCIWEVGSWAEVHTLRGHGDLVRDVCWSPDATQLASAGVDRTVRVWDVRTGTELRCLTGHEDFVQAVAWSPDGTRIASVAHDKTLRIWSAVDGSELLTASGHDGLVKDVCWSPDSRFTATASADGTARIWEADHGAELLILGVHSGGVESVAWSPDAARVATAAQDKTVRIWPVATDLQTLIGRGRSRATRQLSIEERRRHGLP